MSNINTRLVVKTEEDATTYFGRRAVTRTEHHDNRSAGLRTVTTTWIDDADPRNGGHKAGAVVRKVITGDGRCQDFRVVEGPTVLA